MNIVRHSSCVSCAPAFSGIGGIGTINLPQGVHDSFSFNSIKLLFSIRVGKKSWSISVPSSFSTKFMATSVGMFNFSRPGKIIYGEVISLSMDCSCIIHLHIHIHGQLKTRSKIIKLPKHTNFTSALSICFIMIYITFIDRKHYMHQCNTRYCKILTGFLEICKCRGNNALPRLSVTRSDPQWFSLEGE